MALHVRLLRALWWTEARTKAVTSDELIEHVGRMGTSPFEAVSFDVQMDDACGMSFSAVHKVRACSM